MSRISRFVVFACAVFLITSGLSFADANTLPTIIHAKKAWKVGLVYKGTSNELTVYAAAQSQKHAEQIGINLTGHGLTADSDIEGQINIVENMIAQKMDAIVLAPTNAKALVPAVVRAIKAGIIVVNYDSQLDQALLKAAGVEVPYIGPDNESAAKASGDYLGKRLGAGGKVIILEGEPGAANGNQRRQGFMDTVKEYKLNLIDSETAHWNTDPAFILVTNLLTAHPDVQGIMAANDNMALGALRAVDAAGKVGKILIVGFDDIPAFEAEMLKGTVLCSINQLAPEMAAHGIDVAVAELEGTKFSGVVTTPHLLVDKAYVQAHPVSGQR